MMDSQENVLNQEAQLEENKVVETPVENEIPVAEETTDAAEAPVTETPAEERKVYATKKEVIERLKELAHGEENPGKDEVDYLKTTFYKLHFAQRDAEQKAYLEAGGDPEKYVVTPDEDEEIFKAEMGVVKEKRQKIFLQQE